MTLNESVNARTMTVRSQMGDMQNCYDYFYRHYPSVETTSYIYRTCEDRGKRAYEIAKTLMQTDLVQVKTAKQFMELMDTILKAL